MLPNAAGAASSGCKVPSQSISSGEEAGAAVTAPEQRCWPLVAAPSLCRAVSPARHGHRPAPGTASAEHPGPGSAARERAPEPHLGPWNDPHDGGIAFPAVPVPPGGTDRLTDWLTALAPAQEGVHGQDSACCSCSSCYYVLLWLEMPVGLSLTLQAIWIALGQHFHWGNGEKINRFLLLESFFLSTEHGELQGLRAEEMKAPCNVYFLSLLKWTITKNKAKSKTKKLSKCQC